MVKILRKLALRQVIYYSYLLLGLPTPKSHAKGPGIGFSAGMVLTIIQMLSWRRSKFSLRALQNPMETRRVMNAKSKTKKKKTNIVEEPKLPLAVATANGPAPPHSGTSEIGNENAGTALLCNAPAMVEHAPFSCLDGNPLRPANGIPRGKKRKARPPCPKRSAMPSTTVPSPVVPQAIGRRGYGTCPA
jgi:hypothetical protein